MQDLVQPCMFNEILAVRKLAALPCSALGFNMFGGKEIFTIVDMTLFSEHAFARLPFSVAQSSCRGLERPWGSEHQQGLEQAVLVKKARWRRKRQTTQNTLMSGRFVSGFLSAASDSDTPFHLDFYDIVLYIGSWRSYC